MEWINVKDKLPEQPTTGEWMVCIANDLLEDECLYDYGFKQYGKWDQECPLNNVTYWMIIEDPPKE